MNYRKLRIVVMALGIALTSSLAEADTFMLVPGVQGDAVAKGREGWIRIARLEWAVDAASSWTQGAGASVGKPNPGKLVFKLASGPWSNAFLRAIGTGTTVDRGGPIIVDHATGDGRVVMRWTLEGVFATRYGIATNAMEAPQDQLEVVFKSIRVEMNYIGPEVKIAPSGLGWDISRNTVQ
jgi:type VI secretion system secreted protein Hcp